MWPYKGEGALRMFKSKRNIESMNERKRSKRDTFHDLYDRLLFTSNVILPALRYVFHSLEQPSMC